MEFGVVAARLSCLGPGFLRKEETGGYDVMDESDSACASTRSGCDTVHGTPGELAKSDDSDDQARFSDVADQELNELVELGRRFEDDDQVKKTVDRDKVVDALASILTHLASMGAPPQRATRFHSVRPPQLSVKDYLARIATHFHCSNACLVLGLIYIDRIVKLQPDFTISLWSVHRVVLASMMAAAKFHDDVYYSNNHYARVGGVRVEELNKLEAYFLELIKWKLMVSPEEYELYMGHVEMAINGGLQ